MTPTKFDFFRLHKSPNFIVQNFANYGHRCYFVELLNTNRRTQALAKEFRRLPFHEAKAFLHILNLNSSLPNMYVLQKAHNCAVRAVPFFKACQKLSSTRGSLYIKSRVFTEGFIDFNDDPDFSSIPLSGIAQTQQQPFA